jgi:hypothetical protein
MNEATPPENSNAENSNAENFSAENSSAPSWQPLSGVDRRVLGVLVEKAKTTPDNYPLSQKGLCTGCNQKSNRSPQMQVSEEAIEESLERLRKLGAVVFVTGSGRVDKYRHRAYDWLGVDKVELAVIAELLLRGPQTVGELRGRAARMEPIRGLEQLQPLLESLQTKRLASYLTPKGRGAVVTHTLYLEQELEKVRREHGAGSGEAPEATAAALPPIPAGNSVEVAVSIPAPSLTASGTSIDADHLRQLRDEVSQLRLELEEAKTTLESLTTELRNDLDVLNRQLGN